LTPDNLFLYIAGAFLIAMAMLIVYGLIMTYIVYRTKTLSTSAPLFQARPKKDKGQPSTYTGDLFEDEPDLIDEPLSNPAARLRDQKFTEPNKVSVLKRVTGRK
jgi:hypothetical protein